MAQEYFRIKYWAQKNIPMFYISYFYMGKCLTSIKNLELEQFNYFWKFFAENENVLSLAKKYEKIKGKNIIVTGYPKMDKLQEYNYNTDKDEKLIIIAPHHTIEEGETSVGCFLQYSDLFLNLAHKYPDIHFVFRPHPLLFKKLQQEKLWGKEKIDNFLNTFLNHPNTSFSNEGEYLELFAKSDALIHDCGSFTAEYIYTNKPCAYIYRNTINEDLTFTKFGKKCIEQHYMIKSESDFYNFIDNIIIKKNDTKKDERIKFAKENIMINYPHANEIIYNYLKKKLSQERR